MKLWKQIFKRRRSSNAIQQEVQFAAEDLPFKCFGEDLRHISRLEGSTVPNLMTTICEHILSKQSTHLGVFRKSGTAEKIEEMRRTFESTGQLSETDMEDTNSVCGLMKKFIRDLGSPLIDNRSKHMMIGFLKKYPKPEDKDILLERIRGVVHRLGESRYRTLEYLVRFMNTLATFPENLMDRRNLGVIFAPNMFYIPEGIDGLGEQMFANLVVILIMNNFEKIFGESDVWQPRPGYTPPSELTPMKVESDTLQTRQSDTPPSELPPMKGSLNGDLTDSLKFLVADTIVLAKKYFL